MTLSPRILTLSFLVLITCGCSSLSMLNPFSDSGDSSTSRLCAKDNGDFYKCQDQLPEQMKSPDKANPQVKQKNFQMLSEYTEQMATALRQDLQGVVFEGGIVVASFVYVVGPLQTTDQLGYQLAEYFINDLQDIGLPVSDHKLTGMLNFNEKVISPSYVIQRSSIDTSI